MSLNHLAGIGNKLSTLDPLKDILDALYTCTQETLGDDWKRVKFLEEIELNSDLAQNRVYGIRPLEAVEVESMNKFLTLSLQHEIVLVRSKRTIKMGDSDYQSLSFDNRRDILCIYKKIAQTTPGGLGFNVNGFTMSEPEFIEDGKVVVQRATFNIIYRCQI